MAIAREVLAPFGRIATGAFLVAVATGLVSLVTQLGRVAALWDTAYGRLLAVKIVVVGLILIGLLAAVLILLVACTNVTAR